MKYYKKLEKLSGRINEWQQTVDNGKHKNPQGYNKPGSQSK